MMDMPPLLCSRRLHTPIRRQAKHFNQKKFNLYVVVEGRKTTYLQSGHVSIISATREHARRSEGENSRTKTNRVKICCPPFHEPFMEKGSSWPGCMQRFKNVFGSPRVTPTRKKKQTSMAKQKKIEEKFAPLKTFERRIFVFCLSKRSPAH